jgi:hypothetical protein
MKKWILIVLAIMFLAPAFVSADDTVKVGFTYKFVCLTPDVNGEYINEPGRVVKFAEYKAGMSTLDHVSEFFFGEPDRYNKKWEKVQKNLVPTAGLNHINDVVFHGSTQVATWYFGLLAASPTPAAGDTMSSHVGWTEFTAYDEATRPEWTEGAASGGSTTNSSTVDFTCSTDSSTVAGGFITSNNTKSGTTGTLISVAAFSGGNQALDDGDVLKVTATFATADDGA